MPVTLSCNFVEPVAIKRLRKWIYSCEDHPKSCYVILKAEKCVLFGNHNDRNYQLLPASPFSSVKWNYSKMEPDVDPEVIWRNVGSIVYIKWQQEHSGKPFFQNKIKFLGFFLIVLVKASLFMYQLLHVWLILTKLSGFSTSAQVKIQFPHFTKRKSIFWVSVL